MPFSFRVDPKTAAKLRRLSWSTGRSQSDVVREAVEQYEPGGLPATDRTPDSTLVRIDRFVGSISTGGAHLSGDTHAKYRAALQRKHRGRRPR